MSPGTGLLTFLAARAERFGIVVEQSEDEIAAINTAIGAGYAGARAIVTTSGGGFDLMQEGISLAGMTETPVVIHLGQRPGPATGLPTRTEQGDLNLAFHAGHGEFARAIFAPGTLEEAFALAQRAFELAGRFQMPVILLTDQYFLDAISTMDSGNMQRIPSVHHIVKTGENYRRYALTPDGVTPRGVPGYGDGTVRVDSDEHDEQGHITESFEIRRSMVEKRLKRITGIAEEPLMRSVIGPFENAGTVIIAWGSNRGVLEEALEAAGNQTVSAMHFSQVFPLNPGVKTILEGKNIVVLENNASGQFADILHRQTCHDIAGKILKTTGEPFSVEEVAAKIREL
jgi:2-oxoglutarate ferredoxin oxidoreductase subunit alpha